MYSDCWIFTIECQVFCRPRADGNSWRTCATQQAACSSNALQELAAATVSSALRSECRRLLTHLLVSLGCDGLIRPRHVRLRRGDDNLHCTKVRTSLKVASATERRKTFPSFGVDSARPTHHAVVAAHILCMLP